MTLQIYIFTVGLPRLVAKIKQFLLIRNAYIYQTYYVFPPQFYSFIYVGILEKCLKI